MLHAQTSLSIHDSVDYGKDFKEQLDALTDKNLVVRNQIRPDFEPNNSALPLNRLIRKERKERKRAAKRRAQEETRIVKRPRTLLETVFQECTREANAIKLQHILEECEVRNDDIASITNGVYVDLINLRQILQNLPEGTLKRILFHRNLNFVDVTFKHTNDGDIFALYRIFDDLDIDRRNLLLRKNTQELHKYYNRDISGFTRNHFENLFYAMDRKSLLRLLDMEIEPYESAGCSWWIVFNVLTFIDITWWLVCVYVVADALINTDVAHLVCRSKIIYIFETYVIMKGINYFFELFIVACARLFRHPQLTGTRYVMSVFPLASWGLSIVVRHCVVVIGLLEWATTTSSCWKQVTDEAHTMAHFFIAAMFYDTIYLCMFIFAWLSLPVFSIYLHGIAVAPRIIKNFAGSGGEIEDFGEPLIEYIKDRFHAYIKSGDALYDFLVNFSGMKHLVNKNVLTQLLIKSKTEEIYLTSKHVSLWTERDVSLWLRSIGMEEHAQTFFDDGIDGPLLMKKVDENLLRRGYNIKEEDAEIIWDKLCQLIKPASVASWSVSEVGDWLCSINMRQYVEDFREAGIDGTHLVSRYDENLQQVLKRIPEFHHEKFLTSLDEIKGSRPQRRRSVLASAGILNLSGHYTPNNLSVDTVAESKHRFRNSWANSPRLKEALENSEKSQYSVSVTEHRSDAIDAMARVDSPIRDHSSDHGVGYGVEDYKQLDVAEASSDHGESDDEQGPIDLPDHSDEEEIVSEEPQIDIPQSPSSPRISHDSEDEEMEPEQTFLEYLSSRFL